MSIPLLFGPRDQDRQARFFAMELVLGLVLLAGLFWGGARQLRNRSAGTARAHPASARTSVGGDNSPLRADIESSLRRDSDRSTIAPELRRVSKVPSADHRPQRPTGAGRGAWSPRTQQLEVAGEWYCADNLRELFGRHAAVSEAGCEIGLPAVLVPDPTNPFDHKAVAVFVDGLHVGYMERPDAARYHDRIVQLPGGELVTTSRQWMRAVGKDTWARVTLSLPRPEHLECPNELGAACVSLPPGSTIQVTREEQHMDHLVALLATYGSDVVVAATLRSVTEQRPRSTVELVAVDIDGQQVGVLTPTQTANLLPLVQKAEAEGRPVVCRASLRGNTLKADVALHVRKAHELDEEELAELFAAQSG